MPSSKSTIAIYVATERQATEVKGQMAPYRPGTQVGCMGGLGSNPLFMSDLESTLMSGSPGVDMVIFDEASMAEAMGGDGKALVAIVEILSHGLARHIGSIIVYDSMHCINATGVKRLSTMGATVVTDLAEVGGDFARRYGNWDRYADVDPSVRVGPKGGTLPAIGDEGRGDAARRDGLDMPVREDPFDRIAHDPFEGMRDAGRQDEDDATGGGDAEDEAAGGSRGHGGDPGESIGFDPFDIVMQATERGPGGGVSLDDFMRVNMGVGGGESDSYGSDRDRGTKGGRRPDDPRDLKVRRTEEPEWEDFYERQGVPDDLRALAREAADPTSEWIYDDLNESLNGGAGFIRKMKAGKRGGRQVSEVEPHALADSIYIPQYQAENDTAYSVPPETRILSCYSPAGGSGKALQNDTFVYKYNKEKSDFSPVRIADIKENDFILGAQGVPVRVRGVYPQGELDVYEMRLRDGRAIRCSADHIWSVRNTKADTVNKAVGCLDDMTTQELITAGLKTGHNPEKDGYKWQLPVMRTIQYPHRDLALDPYVLGLLIGDGSLLNRAVKISIGNAAREHTVAAIQERLPPHHYLAEELPDNDQQYNWVLKYQEFGRPVDNSKNIYLHEIERLGLNHRTERKFIPEEYLHADERQRRELLAGLLDSDGSVAERGQIQFTTICERLKDDFCELVWSLGYRCSVYEDRREGKYTTGVAYTVHIWTNDTLNLLPEKVARSATHRDALPQRRPPVLPAANPDAPDIELPIPPYLMGRICLTSMPSPKPVQVTSFSDEDRKCLSDLLSSVGCILGSTPYHKENTHRKGGPVRSFTRHCIVKGPAITTRTNPIISILRELGMYGNGRPDMFFPEKYLNGSVRQRKELLQGIMDSFGKIDNGCIYAPARNERFASEFLALAESLGYAAERHTSHGGSYAYDTIRILNTDPSILVHSPDRETYEALCASLDNPGNDEGYVSIVDIVPTGERAPMTCLYVDSPDHLFVAGDYVVTHNTTVAGMIAIQLNWCFNREVMLHRSSAWTCRVLIMSMNEFDDLSVKGLGAPGPMVDEDNHKTIEDLLRIIEDCGGAPTWEEISDCFATNKENYVYYLPSVSLRQRVEHDVNLTSEDYRKVLHVCAKFFEFIILDMPDVMYDHRGGVVEFALNNSNIVVYIMEPDKKSTYLLYQLLMGLVDDDGNRVINPDKWMLVLNKYAKADSPYAGYIEDLNNFGQVSVETVMQTTQNLFFDFKAIPLTSRRASGNILFGRDPYVKQAARDIVDSILRRLDEQEVERTTKKKKH